MRLPIRVVERRRYRDVNMAGMLLGVISILWGYLALKPNAGLFLNVLYQNDARHIWPVLMLLQGGMLAGGSAVNCFPLRQAGLIAGALLWGALYCAACVLYIVDVMDWGVFTSPVTSLVPVLSVFCVACMAAEANRHTAAGAGEKAHGAKEHT